MTADEAVVTVTVVRSGGIAGIPRRWGVEAAAGGDADRWCALVDDCPWDQGPTHDGRDGGADRFAWSVRATTPEATRRAELTETQAQGPWRALIDAVREASTPPAPPTPPAKPNPPVRPTSPRSAPEQ